MSYSQQAFAISDEFRESLTDEDVDALRDDILEMGEDGWYLWVAENHDTIFSLVSLTPAKLAKRREWRDPILRRRLAFAAYRTAHLAGLALSLTDELVPGGGYRETCGQAARAGHRFLLSSRWFWPFGGKLPFEAWQPPDDFGYSISYSARVL